MPTWNIKVQVFCRALYDWIEYFHIDMHSITYQTNLGFLNWLSIILKPFIISSFIFLIFLPGLYLSMPFLILIRNEDSSNSGNPYALKQINYNLYSFSFFPYCFVALLCFLSCWYNLIILALFLYQSINKCFSCIA